MDSDKTLNCNGTYSSEDTYTSWSRPNLSSDGTLGGSSFAVSAPSYYNKYYPYQACDGTDNYQHGWCSRTIMVNSDGFTFYNPDPLKISTLNIHHFTGTVYVYRGYQGKVMGSNTNGNWAQLTSWSVADTTAAADKISLTINNSTPYKYFKIIPTATHSNKYWGIQELLITAQKVVTSYTYYWNKTIS